MACLQNDDLVGLSPSWDPSSVVCCNASLGLSRVVGACSVLSHVLGQAGHCLAGHIQQVAPVQPHGPRQLLNCSNGSLTFRVSKQSDALKGVWPGGWIYGSACCNAVTNLTDLQEQLRDSKMQVQHQMAVNGQLMQRKEEMEWQLMTALAQVSTMCTCTHQAFPNPSLKPSCATILHIAKIVSTLKCYSMHGTWRTALLHLNIGAPRDSP